MSFPGESLDLFGRTTTAPVASLPPWSRHHVSSTGNGRLRVVVVGSLGRVSASAPAFARIVNIVWVALVVAWRMLCRPVFWWMLCHHRRLGDRFGRMLCRLGGLGG